MSKKDEQPLRPECKTCKGKGEVRVFIPGEGWRKKTCHVCYGFGWN